MGENEQKSQPITYGSTILISHLSDEDALIAGDGFIKRSVLLKGMSPHNRSSSKKFSIEQFNQFFMSNCIFLVCPKVQNVVKREILKQISGDDDEIIPQPVPEGEQSEPETSSPFKKDDSKMGIFMDDNKIRDFQTRLINEYKYNVESFEKEKSLQVMYEQPIQLLHIASSKFLACHQKEAKFENQNYKLTLDQYSSEATLFKIVPAFKYQKDGDQVIYASEVVRIIRAVPLLNKITYLHCSGEKIDVKKSQVQRMESKHQKQGELKIQKREVNASLEEATSWKLNLFSECVSEGSKLLKSGDILWLHHSECNATIAATRKSKAFDKSRFLSLDMKEWLNLESMVVSVQSSGISESSFVQYTGNTYSMWVLEGQDYKNGSVVQYERYYRLKHLSSGLYLSVHRPPPEVPPPSKQKKDPYAVTKQEAPKLPKEFISAKDPPAKFYLQTTPDKNTLFEFVALKASEAEKRFISSGAFVYLKNVENKKYIDIVSKLGDEGSSHVSQQKSQHLAQYLKPILQNEKERSDHAVFKLHKANSSETWEVMFLDSCNKVLLKFLYAISGFQWRNDSSDLDSLKTLEMKIQNSSKAVTELDDFLNFKVYNSTPDQKYGQISFFRQTLLRQQFFIDILIKILQESITKNELEMWQHRKLIFQEIEEEEQQKKIDKDQAAKGGAAKKRQNRGVSKKEILEFVIKKVDLCQSIYKLLVSVCKSNNENQLYIFDLLPYFQIHSKFLPSCITFLIEMIGQNLTLLLRLSENLRIEFDYSIQQAVQEDMSKKVKILINLYEKDLAPQAGGSLTQSSLGQSSLQNQLAKLPQNKISFKSHEKITQKPLNLINFFFNVLWDTNSINNEDYLRFLRSICRINQQGVQINQENIYKLYKKFNDHPDRRMLGMFNNQEPDPWDGMLRMNQDGTELSVPVVADRKKYKFIAEQLNFFSEVSYGRNYIWKRELTQQFPQPFLFKNIWNEQANIKLQELRHLLCKLSIALYVDHQPLRKIILPSFCRLFRECDQPKQVNIFDIFNQKPKQNKNIFMKDKNDSPFLVDELQDYAEFKKVYKEFINDLIHFVNNVKGMAMAQVEKSDKLGRDILNNDLIYNTSELIYQMLQLDIFELVDQSQDSLNTFYMQLIEPLVYLIQYDRKNLKFLKASMKSIHGEVAKAKKIKDDKHNPIALPFAMPTLTLTKKEEVVEVEEENEFKEGGQIDDNQLFLNPIMRGYISLNNQLEQLTYQDYSKIKTEIEFKLKICSILDHFLDRRQNFLISNVLVFFRKHVLKESAVQQEDNVIEDDIQQDGTQEINPSEQKIVTLVSDYLLGLIPNIARTGIKDVDNPEKEQEDPFAFMNLSKLANMARFQDKKPEKFTNYFHHFKLEGFNESYDLDQYLSLQQGDKYINEDPIASILPFLLVTFFFVHDEFLEERCLNVTMRVFNQREELRSNLKNLQVLFDEEKTQLFQFIERKMIRLTELIEKSEIWLSELTKKTGQVPTDLEECLDLIENLTIGYFYNIECKEDKIQLVKMGQEATDEQIDPLKQSVMNFLKVHQPIIELIKNGFPSLVQVILDPMYPENKKSALVRLFQYSYTFLQRFVQGNRQNQMIIFENIEVFYQYLQFNLGQVQLIQEIFRDNFTLLTTKVDSILLKRLILMIDHEGRQENFLQIITTLLKHKNKYIFDNQLLILNTFLPMRNLNDTEIKILYADGTKGKSLLFYLDDTVYEYSEPLLQQLKNVDWKDTYRDEPFRYHATLLNMLLQTALIQSDRRQYDPNLNDINNRDNFNISAVKLKKMITAEKLLEMLRMPDDFVQANYGAQTNIFNLFGSSKQEEDHVGQKEKAIGYTLLKQQICEFLRLVHITSDKRPPQNTEMAHLRREICSLIEMESKRLEKVNDGAQFSIRYVNYLIEGFLPLLISFHERILVHHNSGSHSDIETAFENYSIKLAHAIESKLYKPLRERRQAQIIHKFADYYPNKIFRMLLQDSNFQNPNFQKQKPNPAGEKLIALFEGVWADDQLIESKENPKEISREKTPNKSVDNLDEQSQLLKSPQGSISKSKKKDKEKTNVFGGFGNSLFKLVKSDDKKKIKDLSNQKDFDQEDLMMIEDQWNEFLYQLVESKKLQEEVEQEKQVLADAIINVEKLMSPELAAGLEVKPNIDLVIRKFINFLQYAVKQPKNKDTVVTLLKIMRKIVEKEEDVGRKLEIQNNFDKLGATKMILMVISEQSKQLHSDILMSILQFANTLLQGGNVRVQKTVHDFFLTYSQSENIFQTFADIIRQQIVNIEIRSKERQFQQGLTLSETNSPRGEEQPSVVEEESGDQESQESQEKILNQILSFLQNCVEGHHLDLQNYLRQQHNSRTSYDMINLIADLLKTYYTEERTIRMFNNMIKCLDTLNELVQGPCPENQIAVAESKFFDIVLKIFPLRKPQIEKQQSKRSVTSAKSSKRGSMRRKTKFGSSDQIEPWMVARIQNKVLILVLSLLEMREIKGKSSIIKRIMRNLPINVLERHMCKVYKKYSLVYQDKYLMDSLKHLEVDPRDLEAKERDSYHKKYFETVLQNGFYIFGLICYYFESDETFDSPLINMHKIYVKTMVRKDAGGLFSPDSTLGQLIQLVMQLIEQSLMMAAALQAAALAKMKGANQEELQLTLMRQKVEERKRRLKKSFNFFMGNTAHIEVIRNEELELIIFPLLPYCKCFPKDQKQLFTQSVDRSSVKAKVQGLVEKAPEFIEIMIHEEQMKRFYSKYPILGFFATYIQLWKDIAYYLTLVLNLFIIGSFAVIDPENVTDIEERKTNYPLFRKPEWTQERTNQLFFVLGMTMTICALFVVVFFLSKIAPLIIKRAWKQKPLFDEPRPGLIKSLFNLLYKLFFVLFSCLADFEVLYYLGYGVMAVIGTIIHPFFYCFHLTVILIRYPTLKNVIRAVSDPKEQLILSLVLLLILTYIQSLVAYLTLQTDYEGICNQLLYCFLFIFDFNYKTPGGVGGQLTSDKPSAQYEPARFLSDTFNNIILVVIMPNIVAGIIIDTFGSLREEENDKQSDIKDKCFICGMEKENQMEVLVDSNSIYELTIICGITYIVMISTPTNYIADIAYLEWKDPQDYSGIESYIRGKLDAADLSWIPFNKAMELAELNDDESAVQRKQMTSLSDDVILNLYYLIKMYNMLENTQQILKAIKLKDKRL